MATKMITFRPRIEGKVSSNSNLRKLDKNEDKLGISKTSPDKYQYLDPMHLSPTGILNQLDTWKYNWCRDKANRLKREAKEKAQRDSLRKNSKFFTLSGPNGASSMFHSKSSPTFHGINENLRIEKKIFNNEEVFLLK